MNTNIIKTIISGILLLSGSLASATSSGFAIVVDEATYQEAKTEITEYAASVEKDGLKTFIVLDKWGVPDSIKATLKQLYKAKNNPIEGAVFIGDIPIPMLRDAQHLTSAFKMNQITFPRTESSVPSDRFYDDFDLQFKYLDRDSVNTLYHYYSLLPQSPQYLAPEIYSGRIKAVDNGVDSKYELIRRYLRKAVAAKAINNKVDQYLFFSGHGYVSESMMARIDEKGAILQNFPWMQQQAQGIEYIDHKRDKAVKGRLMSELQRRDLDIAVLHHHGDSEIQYLNNLPDPQSIPESIELVKMYMREVLRSHVAKGQNPDSVKLKVSRNLSHAPTEWFAGAMDSAVIAKDSIFNRGLDLFFDDFAKFTPNVKLLLLDACFNGSFHKDRYIAGGYIFDEGATLVVLANSVNVLQDKWTDRYVGLMGMGMRAGYLEQYNAYLEGHLFGDPTFHFTPTVNKIDVNQAMQGANSKLWKKQLSGEYPALRAMAARKLVDAGVLKSSELLDLFKSDRSEIVRLETMILLSQFDNSDFVKSIDLAVNDSYEMIQRFAVNFIAKRGDKELAAALVRLAVRNNTAERIEFAVKQAAALYSEADLIEEFNRQFDKTAFVDGENVGVAISSALKKYANSWRIEEISSIYSNDTLTTKQLLNRIRSLRTSPMHNMVPQLLDYLQRCDKADVQVALLEALGWFRHSYRHSEISAVALKMSNNVQLPQTVRDEALKTYNRIENNRL
ncbi:MAG: HEAT repeat domain-containing protein [Muribaculaceae bacterium]|nr:HEAT repeat domain-containing protein [Muribaculaceae bacterium]